MMNWVPLGDCLMCRICLMCHIYFAQTVNRQPSICCTRVSQTFAGRNPKNHRWLYEIGALLCICGHNNLWNNPWLLWFHALVVQAKNESNGMQKAFEKEQTGVHLSESNEFPKPHSPSFPNNTQVLPIQHPSISISHTILNPFQSHLLHLLRLVITVSHNRGYDCKKVYKSLVMKDLFHF